LTDEVDYTLSNGMEIPHPLIKSIQSFGKIKILTLDTGYGPKYDLKIFDEGDGKPYRFTEVNRELGVHQNEKNFTLTYRFCDKHDPYPIWEPTAFRSDPCYLEGTRLLSGTK
jgi:hypothetical protein